MKLFATRVWGYDPKKFPIASFGTVGLCDNLIRKSALGDRLVLVGTKGHPTALHERGKILGYIEFGHDVVNTLDVSAKADYPPEAFDLNGNLKWPKALAATRAWKITMEPLPDLVPTIGRQFSRDATTMAVDLSDDEAAKILALPAEEVSIPETETLIRLQRRRERLAPAGRSKGPVPSERGRGEYMLGQTSYTYAMQFGNHPCFKVGFSNDPKRRLDEVNKHVPFEVLKEAWTLMFKQQWEDEHAAFKMEQAILDAFPQDKITGERVRVPKRTFEDIWYQYLDGRLA